MGQNDKLFKKPSSTICLSSDQTKVKQAAHV